MKPILANIVGQPSDSATKIKASTAVCHSSICCSAFGSFWMYRGSVLRRDELATAAQRYRIVERSFPAAISRHAAA